MPDRKKVIKDLEKIHTHFWVKYRGCGIKAEKAKYQERLSAIEDAIKLLKEQVSHLEWLYGEGKGDTEMPDREKVIKAWEIFRDSNPYEICSGREFRAIREPEYCMGQMIEDTIELLKKFGELQERHKILVEKADDMYSLLKEQEAVKPILKREGRNKIYNDYVCPRCDNEVVYEQNFCSECGVPFLWEGR